MKLIHFIVQIWFTSSYAIADEMKSSSYEDDHLSELLKKYMLLETTTEHLIDQNEITTEDGNRPIFESVENTLNLTTQFGNTIILHCKVNNLGDKMVSWVRRSGEHMHLLSYGLQVYSSDERYQLKFHKPNDWQLIIKYANERDEGHYECQVSTHPPIVIKIYLTVIVPELEIADERGLPIKNKFYDIGSTMELKCVIMKVPHHSDNFIMWKHGTRILNYDTTRGGISVKTEILSNGAKSVLFVGNVKSTDSGNYTCSLADFATTSVYVQVLNGETPAAMQHGEGSNGAELHLLLISLALVLEFIIK